MKNYNVTSLTSTNPLRVATPLHNIIQADSFEEGGTGKWGGRGIQDGGNSAAVYCVFLWQRRLARLLLERDAEATRAATAHEDIVILELLR